MSAPKRNQAGMTLLEVLIAVAITSLVMSLAVSVVGSGVRLARQGEQTVASNEAARAGMEMVLRDLRAAGVPGGIWVTAPGGTPVRINSIFTQPGTGIPTDANIDDLWMVVPRPNAMQANCSSPGSGAVVAVKTLGAITLTVNCTGMFAVGDTLLVSNFQTAALITVTAKSATTLDYAQAECSACPTTTGTSSFSSLPDKGGFQKGDLVFPVDIVRYQVRNNLLLASATYPLGRPELIRSRGSVKLATLTAAAPFEVVAGAPEQRFPDVEDLQVAWGTGTPPSLVFASGHNVAFNAATAPLSARVSVVGITPRAIIDDQNKIQPYGPVVVENHDPYAEAPPAVLDGYRRSVYRRRVELLNLGAVNL